MLINPGNTSRPGPRTRWTRHLETREPPDSPATVGELWAYMDMPGDAPSDGEARHEMLAMILASAADYVSGFTGRELGTRQLVCLFDFRALEGQTSHDVLTFPLHDQWLELPRPPAQSVDAVRQADGDGGFVEIEEYTVDLVSEPARIQVLSSLTFPGTFSTTTDAYFGALRVEFTAGYETVPSALKMAVLMMAGYLHDHRGCGMADAWRKSGARDMARRYTVNVVL